jgi:general secretion pathway protein A
MYTDFYHLTKEPFHITPDPEFLFLSPSHKEALASMIYGVEEGKGFIVITGEVGVGKTTILHSFLEKADKERLRIVYIFYPNISFKSLLDTIYRELELTRKADDLIAMLNRLHYLMVEESNQGHKMVIIIDEAQSMPVKTLDNLRMLSNIETATDKLIQIVMVGQPGFEQTLNQKELWQLKQRVAIHCVIKPFTRKESIDYISYRLGKVNTKSTFVFTRGAIKKIVRQAKGIPRIINILCDNALITGYGYKEKPVTSRIVKEVVADFEEKRKSSFWKWLLAPLAAFLLVAALLWIPPFKSTLLLNRSDDASRVVRITPHPAGGTQEVLPAGENTQLKKESKIPMKLQSLPQDVKTAPAADEEEKFIKTWEGSAPADIASKETGPKGPNKAVSQEIPEIVHAPSGAEKKITSDEKPSIQALSKPETPAKNEEAVLKGINKGVVPESPLIATKAIERVEETKPTSIQPQPSQKPETSAKVEQAVPKEVAKFPVDIAMVEEPNPSVKEPLPIPKPVTPDLPSASIAFVKEEEVRQFFANYIDRYSRKDIGGFLSSFSTRAIQNHKDGLEAIRKMYTDFFDQSQELRYNMDNVKIEIYQNGVEVMSRYELEQLPKKGVKRIWRGQIRWVLVEERGTLKILSLEYQQQQNVPRNP